MPNTQDARVKGYDGGKQVGGIKRPIGVDTQGLPHVVDVTRANTDDRKGMSAAFRRNRSQLDRVESVLGDGGYEGQNFADTVARDLNGATVQIARRPESHAFKVLPQRWVVERSFAWLEQCRRLWKNCERYLLESPEF